jgi:hypothetical protein
MPVAIWATRSRRKPRARDVIVQILRIAFISLLLVLLGDLIVILVLLLFPFQFLSPLLAPLVPLLDLRLIVSEGLADVSVGVVIAYLLWRGLGQRKLSIIEEVNAMIKYDHLKVTKYEESRYVVNRETNRGYLLSPIIEKLVDQGIILTVASETLKIRDTETGSDGVYLEKREPTIKELRLSRLD